MVVTNPGSWEFTQKMIRIGHNRAVKQFFKDIQADNRRDTGRAALKKSMLIQPEDSALEVMNKQMYFQLGLKNLSIDAIASVPDHWPVKVGAERPQLLVIFRPATKTPQRTGNYELPIPHYDGPKNPQIPFYKKGNYQGILTLKDNSKLIVNAVSEREVERVVNVLKRYIDSRYRTNNLKIGPLKGKPFNEIRVKPLRADFYPTGFKNDLNPKWRHYF